MASSFACFSYLVISKLASPGETGAARRRGGGRDRQGRWRPGGKRGTAVGGDVIGGRGSKGGSSGLWMKRHLKDPYVSAATESGAPSRAAFKLVEINDKHGVLAPGDRVVDLGAAPGGWSMVAARVVFGDRHHRARRAASRSHRGGRAGAPPSLPSPLPIDGSEALTGREGAVVAVDLLEMDPLPGVQIFRGDFRDAHIQREIFSLLAGESPSVPLASADEENAPHGRENPTGDPTVAGDESGRSEAFLLRGTSSSSGSLLPRPMEPSVDSLEALHHSVGKPNPNLNPSEAAVSPPRDVETRSRAAEGVGDSSARYPAERSSETPDGGNLARAPLGTIRRMRRADVVLSDMSPSFTGDRDTDQARAAGLVLDALAVCAGDESMRRKTEGGGGDASGSARQEIGKRTEETEERIARLDDGGEGGDAGLLARGGTFLGKFFAGRDENEVKSEASRLFRRVRIVKPPASRARSSEMYLLATGFLEE